MTTRLYSSWIQSSLCTTLLHSLCLQPLTYTAAGSLALFVPAHHCFRASRVLVWRDSLVLFGSVQRMLVSQTKSALNLGFQVWTIPTITVWVGLWSWSIWPTPFVGSSNVKVNVCWVREVPERGSRSAVEEGGEIPKLITIDCWGAQIFAGTAAGVVERNMMRGENTCPWI
jgi:hypothetical protein